MRIRKPKSAFHAERRMPSGSTRAATMLRSERIEPIITTRPTTIETISLRRRRPESVQQ